MTPGRKCERTSVHEALSQTPLPSVSIHLVSMALAAPRANVCSYLRARRSLCLSGSHRFAQCQKLTRRAEHWELAVRQLLRKGRAIEMIHEDLHERRAMEIRKQIGRASCRERV